MMRSECLYYNFFYAVVCNYNSKIVPPHLLTNLYIFIWTTAASPYYVNNECTTGLSKTLLVHIKMSIYTIIQYTQMHVNISKIRKVNWKRMYYMFFKCLKLVFYISFVGLLDEKRVIFALKTNCVSSHNSISDMRCLTV